MRSALTEIKLYGHSFADKKKEVSDFGCSLTGTGDYMIKPAAIADNNGMIYPCGKEMFLFDPKSNNWSYITDYPVYITGVTCYGLWFNNKVYVGTSSQLLYSYDPNSQTWKNENAEMIPLSNASYFHSEGFIQNGKVYIGFGRQPSVWEFDPTR